MTITVRVVTPARRDLVGTQIICSPAIPVSQPDFGRRSKPDSTGLASRRTSVNCGDRRRGAMPDFESGRFGAFAITWCFTGTRTVRFPC